MLAKLHAYPDAFKGVLIGVSMLVALGPVAWLFGDSSLARSVCLSGLVTCLLYLRLAIWAGRYASASIAVGLVAGGLASLVTANLAGVLLGLGLGIADALVYRAMAWSQVSKLRKDGREFETVPLSAEVVGLGAILLVGLGAVLASF
jgi:hypothetical protein